MCVFGGGAGLLSLKHMVCVWQQLWMSSVAGAVLHLPLLCRPRILQPDMEMTLLFIFAFLMQLRLGIVWGFPSEVCWGLWLTDVFWIGVRIIIESYIKVTIVFFELNWLISLQRPIGYYDNGPFRFLRLLRVRELFWFLLQEVTVQPTSQYQGWLNNQTTQLFHCKLHLFSFYIDVRGVFLIFPRNEILSRNKVVPVCWNYTYRHWSMVEEKYCKFHFLTRSNETKVSVNVYSKKNIAVNTMPLR